MERQTSWRISFRVNDLRKLKDGGAHGSTEAKRYCSLYEHIGVDEYAGYCNFKSTHQNWIMFSVQ